MRAIDADKLQQIFNKTSTALMREPKLLKDMEHMVRAFLMTTEMIKDAPTIETEPAKWISVEGRLPEKEAYVLVWYEYFRYGDYNCLYQTYGIAAYSERYGWHGDDLNGDSVKVLYWQPLPEPPERSDTNAERTL